MVRIPEFTSSRGTAVEQAQFVPLDIADTGQGLEARALGELGRGIGQAGQVIAQLESRERKANDLVSSDKADVAREAAVLDFEEHKRNFPDEATWEAKAAEIWESTNVTVGRLKFSGDTSERELIKQGKAENLFLFNARTDVATRRIGNAVQSTKLAVERGFETGAQDMDDRIESYKEALSLQESPEVVDDIINATIAAGTAKSLQNEAAIRPDEVTGSINKELDLRKEGKEGELSILSNTELNSIKKYAGTITNQRKANSEVVSAQLVEDNYSSIIKGDIDLIAMINNIQSNPQVLASESNKAVVSTRSFFSTWNSASKGVTSNSTRTKALTIKDDVLNGVVTRDEGVEAYNKLAAQETIDTASNKEFLNGIFAANVSQRTEAKKRQGGILSSRKKKLRDAIETQQSFLAPEEAPEILRDFANEAIIELDNEFGEPDAEFETKDLDSKVDSLIRKFTLSIDQQAAAVEARRIRLAENLKEQQDSILKMVQSTRSAGDESRALEIMDRAVQLGIFEIIDDKPVRTFTGIEDKEKKKIDTSFFEFLRGARIR